MRIVRIFCIVAVLLLYVTMYGAVCIPFTDSRMKNNDIYVTPQDVNITCDNISENGIDLKPIIEPIDDIEIIPMGDYVAQVAFTVKYLGADYITVDVEEEYDSCVRTYRFDEPYIAHIKTGNISTLYYTWIKVMASNKYGTTYERLEIEPQFSGGEDLIETLNCDNDETLTVYSINGGILYSGDLIDINMLNLSTGVYIFAKNSECGMRSFSKVFIQN